MKIEHALTRVKSKRMFFFKKCKFKKDIKKNKNKKKKKHGMHSQCKFKDEIDNTFTNPQDIFNK